MIDCCFLAILCVVRPQCNVRLILFSSVNMSWIHNVRIPLSAVFLVQCLVVAAGFALVISLTLVSENRLIGDQVGSIISSTMAKNSLEVLLPLTYQAQRLEQLRLTLTSRGIDCKTLSSVAHSDYISSWMEMNIAMQNNSVAAFVYENWREAGDPPDPYHPEFVLWGECGCEQGSQLCGFNRNATRRAFHGGPLPSSFLNATTVSSSNDANPGKASYVTSSITNIPAGNSGYWAAPYVWVVVLESGERRLTNLFSFYLCIERHSVDQTCVHSLGIDVSLDSITSVISSFASTPSSSVALVDLRGGLLMAHTMSFSQTRTLSGGAAAPFSATATPSGELNRAVADFTASCGADGAACGIRIQRDGSWIVTAYHIAAVNGISLLLIDFTPRSFHYATFDSNRRTSIVLAVIVPLFVTVVCCLVWVSVVVSMRRVGRKMEKAASLRIHQDDGEWKKWLFVKEVSDLHDSYLVMYDRMQELRPFVPHSLFVAAPQRSDSTVTSVGPTPRDAAVSKAHEPMLLGDPQLAMSTFDQQWAAEEYRTALSYGSTSRATFSLTDNIVARTMVGNLAEQRINKFSRVNCSVLFVKVSQNYDDTSQLADDTAQVMKTIIECVLHFDGVIDLLRPDLVVVSFGAHHQQNIHQTAATRCALTIVRRVPDELVPFLSLLVDTGEYLVGTCGNKAQASRAVFGQRMRFMALLQSLACRLLTARVVCTEKTANAVTFHPMVPIDFIVPLDLDGFEDSSRKAHGYKLFEVIDREAVPQTHSAVVALAEYREAFGSLLCGDYNNVETILSRIAPDAVNPSLHANIRTILELLPHLRLKFKNGYRRRELLPFDTFDRAPQPQPRRTSCRGAGSTIRLSDVSLIKNSANQSSVEPCSSNVWDEAVDTTDNDPGMPLFEMVIIDDNATDDIPEGGGLSDTGELPLCIVDKESKATWVRSREPLGTGAYASVYRGLTSAGVFVALKCIDLSARHVRTQDVIAEVNIACKLRHENIVNFLSWVRVSRYLVITMEIVPGGTLMNTLTTFGPIAAQAVRRYTLDALNGLAYLHGRQLVHADVKPHNMLVGMDGTVKLSDFGTAFGGSSSLAFSAMCPPTEGDIFELRGTPAYLAPEVAFGELPTAASDIFALGISVYQLLTSELPWAVAPGRTESLSVLMRNDAACIQAIGNGSLVPSVRSRNGVAIDGHMKHFIECCLQRDPSARPSAEELLNHQVFLV